MMEKRIYNLCSYIGILFAVAGIVAAVLLACMDMELTEEKAILPGCIILITTSAICALMSKVLGDITQALAIVYPALVCVFAYLYRKLGKPARFHTGAKCWRIYRKCKASYARTYRKVQESYNAHILDLYREESTPYNKLFTIDDEGIWR